MCLCVCTHHPTSDGSLFLSVLFLIWIIIKVKFVIVGALVTWAIYTQGQLLL